MPKVPASVPESARRWTPDPGARAETTSGERLSFFLSLPDSAPDEYKQAAARRISAMLKVPDPDGRMWRNGKPFGTGAEYLDFMRGMEKSGNIWEYAADDETKAFFAADDAGKAEIARKAAGLPGKAWEAGQKLQDAFAGDGLDDGHPDLKDAPEDVLAANARLRADREARRRYNLEQTARSEPFRDPRAKEEADADRQAVDAWRAGRRDKTLADGHAAKLLDKNLWAVWLAVAPSLSEDARRIAEGAVRGRRLAPGDIAAFQRLDEKEQAAVAKFARLSRDPEAGTFWNTLGDAGIGFLNGVATLPGNAVRQLDTLATSIDQAVFGKDAGLVDNAEMNRRARTEQRLREALDDPAGIDPMTTEHGWLARSVIGAASTIPYMGYASLGGGAGFSAVALDFMQRMDDSVAAEGGDVFGRGTGYAAYKALLGVLYTGLEKVQGAPIFGPDLGLKNAMPFLKLGTRHGPAAVENVLLHWGKETLKETLQESAQAIVEAHGKSAGLELGPGWGDAFRAGAEEFTETLGTMGILSAAGTGRQTYRTRSAQGRSDIYATAINGLRRNTFLLSDNPYAGRGTDADILEAARQASLRMDGYRAAWKNGGTAALEGRGDLSAEEAALLGHVFEGEAAGSEIGSLITGRNLWTRTPEGRDSHGGAGDLDLNTAYALWKEGGADGRGKLAGSGFTEAGAAKLDEYFRTSERVQDNLLKAVSAGWESDPAARDARGAAIRERLELQPLREIYQRAGTRDGAAKAFRELNFTQEQSDNLAAAFEEERALAVSPQAAAAWRAAYLDASREAAPGERLRRMAGFAPRPAPEAGEGAYRLTRSNKDGKVIGEILLRPEAETFDPESRFAGEAVEQATAGVITEADWNAYTPEERRGKAAELGIRALGGFTVTDPADPTVRADGAQADILTGKIALSPDAPSATLYHEAAHAWLAVMRRAGKITEAGIAKLREAYGPSAADPQWFNEEALADDIREIGAETDYAPDKPLARRFIDAVRRLAGAARAEESRRTAASGARQALYESIVYGKPFEGVGDFAAVPETGAGAEAGAADPLGGAVTAKAATGDGERETGDGEQGTGDGEQGTGDGQPGNKARKPAAKKPGGGAPPETDPKKRARVEWKATTPQRNYKVGGQWVIAPRDRFISDTDPRYDFSLQNRKRDDTASSDKQVAKIVTEFDAVRLMDSPTTDTGSPIAVPIKLKNEAGKEETWYMVLSGNGRFRALDLLDADHRGDEYRNPVQAFADERGIPYDPADMTEAARPRLARVLLKRPPNITNRQIAQFSNKDVILPLTEAQQAHDDAALIEREGKANLYSANKDGLPSRNGSDEFFSWFVEATGADDMLDSKNVVTDAARDRGRRAMLALAIGRGALGKETAIAFLEQSSALGLERQREALLMSAGALMAVGDVNPAYMLADEMSAAAASVLDLARLRKSGRRISTDDHIGQTDMFDEFSRTRAEIVRILDSGRPGEGMAEAFRRYADLASKIDTDTDDMFGDIDAKKSELLAKAAADTDVKAPAGPRYSIALAARRYALATGMPAEGERLMARQLEFLFARHMDPAYIASRARAAETRRANAAAAERAKAVARRDAHGRALANPDDPQAWAEAFAASEDGTVSRVAHDFFMGGDGPQRFPHAYGGKPLYGTRVNTPRDAAALLMPLRNPYQESFKAIFLDDKRRVLGAEVCTLGLLDSAPVHPREVFKRGIELGASQVILSHNHPSGNPAPSKEDRDITRRLDEAAKLIGLQYIEHIITDGDKYYSLASESLEELAGPGQAAWESAAAGETRHIREPQTVAALARALRQGADNVIHAVMLDKRNRIVAVKRIPIDPARIADPAYQDETVTREALRAAVANPTAAIILEVTDRAVTAYAAQGLHARAESQARAVGIQLHDTLYRQGGWSWSVKEGARVMPLDADAAAEPAAPRYSVSVNLDDYFNADPEAREIPLDALRTIKDEPEQSVANALRHIRAAKAGERARRAPVSVADNGDGTFTVIDGNATSAALARMGHASVRARVEGANTGTRLGNSALILRGVETSDPGGRLRQRGLDGMDTEAAIDRLLDMARENTPAVRKLCEAAARGSKVTMRKNLKGRDRIREKAREDYGGDAACVTDITGGEVWLRDSDDFNDALKAIRGNLPEGAEIAKVKLFNIRPDTGGGYGDVKVSVRFANGGTGEIILAAAYMLEAKHNRGGHHLYKITRALDKYSKKGNAQVDEVWVNLKKLERALYARGAAAPDAASFASMKSRASSALTFLLSGGNASISSEDISLVKSLSSDLHLAMPPSVDSYAMPALSFMKNMSTPFLSQDKASVTYTTGNVNAKNGEEAAKTPDMRDIALRLREKYANVFAASKKEKQAAVDEELTSERARLAELRTQSKRSSRVRREIGLAETYIAELEEDASDLFNSAFMPHDLEFIIDLAEAGLAAETELWADAFFGAVREGLVSGIDATDVRRLLDAARQAQAAPAGMRYSIQSRRLEPLGLPDGLAEVSAGTSVAALSQTKFKPERARHKELRDAEDWPAAEAYARALAGAEPTRLLGSYLLAKYHGDVVAAKTVVERWAKPEEAERIRERVGDAGLLKPVIAAPCPQIEGNRYNALPQAYAAWLAIKLGGSMSRGFFKLDGSGAANTGAAMSDRVSRDYAFEGGEDIDGASPVILVDDVWTSGQTLWTVYEHIKAVNPDAHVAAFATLASGRYGKNVRPTPKQLTSFWEKSNLTTVSFKERVGNDIEKLTGSEIQAYILTGGRGPDAAAAFFGGSPRADRGTDAEDGEALGRARRAAPVLRYAIDLTGAAYSKENLLVGFMAHADLTGRAFPSRGTVAALAEKIGLENHRYDDLARRARALAEQTTDDAIRKAAASADPGNAAYAIGELARRAERALVRAGAAEGAKLALNEGRIRTLSEAGVAAAMRAVTGADYADIETDTDIDIAASILAADPKAFDEQRERARAEAAGVLPGAPADTDPAAPADPAARALPETDEDAPELTDRQRAEIARKRREREARIQAMLDAARDRAARNRFRDEERRRRKAANQKAEAEEEAAAGGAAQGGADTDAASAPAPAEPGADNTGPASPADFSDRWEAAAFLRVWAFDRFRRDNPNSRDAQRQDLSKIGVAVEFYRKTAVRELTALARKLLEPGAPRETVRAMIADIVYPLTANQIERRTADVFGVINRHAVREKQRSLVKRFKGEIKRQYIKGKEFEELGVDLGRALTGAIEEDARYIVRVCDLSDRVRDGDTSALQDERNRLEAVIAQREGMTDEAGNPLDVGKDDMAARRAMRQLALLDKYGAMVDMMPGEILDLTGEALATLGREAVELRERWAEYDKLVKSIRDPLVRSIARGIDDPQAADSLTNRAADSLLSMLRQRLDFLTRFEKDPAKREAARAAISDLMNLLADGHTDYTNAVADDRAALMGALGQIFRRDDGRPDRKKIRAYLRRLDERVPRELAARLTRQGRQNGMTYGQMLHLLAYLDQWASYKDNIIRHDRRGQAALIRSFVFEDPKTGEARRALTNEDTQLVEWLRRAHYAGKRGAISAVTRRLAGRGIDSPDPLYHPVKMLLSRTSALAAAPGGAAWQPLAGAFSRRVRNNLDVDETASILDLFHSRSHDTAVLTAFGERGLMIREALTSRGFQDAVRRFHGDRALSKILRQVAQSLDGGRARGGGQSAAASLAQRLTTYIHLGFNLTSAAKQTVSLPVFATRIGFRRLWSIITSPRDKDAWNRMRESAQRRARYGTGPASGMNAADREAYAAPDSDPFKRFFGDWGLSPMRKVDYIVSMWIGQGIYRDFKAKYLDMGMGEADADRRAMSETWSVIEETQQSSRAENLPEMAREHGFLGRLMVQFATSPLQQMQFEIKPFAEWRDLVANGGPEAGIREARNRFMRAVFINHVLVNGAMLMVSNIIKLVFGDEPDWEKEGFWHTLLIAALIGPFSRIFITGALAEQTLRVLFLRKPPYMGQLVPAEGVIRFAGNLAYPVRDIVTWDTEHMQADIMRLLRSIALTRLPVKIYEAAAGDE